MAENKYGFHWGYNRTLLVQLDPGPTDQTSPNDQRPKAKQKKVTPHLGFAHGIQHFLWCFHLSCAIVVFEPRRFGVFRWHNSPWKGWHKNAWNIWPGRFQCVKSLEVAGRAPCVMILSPTWSEFKICEPRKKPSLTFHYTGCSIGILMFITSQIYTFGTFSSQADHQKNRPLQLLMK